MFKGQEIGIKDVNGKPLCCGDIVEVVYEHPFGEVKGQGTITYNEQSAMFMVDFWDHGATIAVEAFVENGILYKKPDEEFLLED